MIRRLFCVFLTLVVFCGTASANQEEYSQNFVRLHVVAQDDSKEAQAVKLAVRDACLACAREWMADCRDAEEAYETLQQNLEALREAASQAAQDMHYSGEITVETGVFDFPDRIDGEVRVPAGEYRALRITLGSGQGHNWWCVLYPTLCGLDEAEYAAAQGEVTFYSAIGRWLKRLFGGNAA